MPGELPMSVKTGIGLGLGIPIGIAFFGAGLLAMCGYAVYSVHRTVEDGRELAAEASAAAIPQPVPAASTAKPESPPPPPTSRSVYAASFQGSRLTGCSELTLPAAVEKIMAEHGLDPAKAATEDLEVFLRGGETMVGGLFDDAVGKGVIARVRPPGSPQVIAKPCKEQFPGRRVMGRCAAAVSGKSASITLVVHYYSASQGDAPMQACLAAKGDWWEASEPLRSTRKMIEDLERL
ncbi:MAG: hypothetical protein DIU78_019865 [Pseudomonadota bacterium]|nr:MAG: hypothetical protein DIU78_25325 [Pseudomonadota bacterium]